MIDYTRQTRFSDPGPYAALFDPIPADPAAISEVVRNIHVHYRASGIPFWFDRLAEIDNRWVAVMLRADQRRNRRPLTEPRRPEDRIVGCCRDASLLAAAMLRAKGIPARTRIGFADYLIPGYHVDHVVTEYHDGGGWVAFDAEVGLSDVPLGPGGLRTAAWVWQEYRQGRADIQTYGVGPGIPVDSAVMARDYVLYELAHRFGDELLLWDVWGEIALRPGGDLTLIDDIAALLLAADAGDVTATARLVARYPVDPRLRPGETIVCRSPAGMRYVSLTGDGPADSLSADRSFDAFAAAGSADTGPWLSERIVAQ